MNIEDDEFVPIGSVVFNTKTDYNPKWYQIKFLSKGFLRKLFLKNKYLKKFVPYQFHVKVKTVSISKI